MVENQKKNARNWRNNQGGGTARTVTTYFAPMGQTPGVLKEWGNERSEILKPEGGGFKRLTEREMQ
ncbi:hypothetical protein, partial [Streptococcus anginosus]|uniref:hypothetical protein n=1 Tax=Streptococcus anginosus TaxID=1328 RepID=UPI002EDB6D1B